MASIKRKPRKNLGPLNLSDEPLETPDTVSCLIHLRLLDAFEKLKSRTGLKDGLWDIWDNRASSADNSLDILVKLREKRWAVYVARAVDRYQAWWESFRPVMLLQSDMFPGSATTEKYTQFLNSEPISWREEDLPPLDVLMVWHAHMLSPRVYLEDCLRYGHGPLWAAGMPWKLVRAALQEKSDFSFTVGADCVESWEKRTGRDWENALDPLEKEMRCPSCGAELRIPWTTCGLPQEYDGDR
ncbi:hypothetical protein JDV02_000441 [Purpureocillium takamizusanense]|uniref:Uncharacterized protein n=1 Tax=Purpureocillium takamizusanense TaxID=2060973 RepID=A0A9Q8Q642_9HYPO|nr:uncharacterized protein JDV02_000441 [Purpureocillium takamizusanense]UNI13725.1 hypothetical protein JDV02_000441 [Purpureocillium takamizusanense]